MNELNAREKGELIGNLVDVSMVTLHDATKDNPSPMFPNGIVSSNNGDVKYTAEAIRKYNELFDIYKSIIEEFNP